MTYDEMMQFVSDIPSNYNKNTFDVLYEYVPTLPKGHFVDFGTGLGKSVVAIASLNKKLKITTIDNAVPYNFDNYEEHISGVLKAHGVANRVTNILGNSTSPKFNYIKKIVGLNIDSDHTYETTKKEMDIWIPKVIPNGLIFMDDYLVDRCGVKQAVDEWVIENKGVVKILNPDNMCLVMRKL